MKKQLSPFEEGGAIQNLQLRKNEDGKKINFKWAIK